MAREITSHKVNGLNEKIMVQAVDEPGVGGACHHYRMILDVPAHGINRKVVDIEFQNGPITPKKDPENYFEYCGENGFSIEAIVAIAEDRLLGFQSGPYACRENALALTKLQEALFWLQKRTRDRVARGVEGTLQK